MNWILRRADEWIASRNPDLLRDAHTPSAWVATVVGAGIYVASLRTTIDGFPVWETMLRAIPMFLSGVALLFCVRRDVLAKRALWALDQLQAALMTYWFVWVFAASRLHGALAGEGTLGILFFVTGYFAYAYGATLRYPFPLISLVVPIVLVLGAGVPHVMLLLPVFWAILGRLGQTAEATRRRQEAFAVLNAVERQTREHAQLQKRVTKFRMDRHDLRSLLMALQGNLEILEMDGGESGTVERLQAAADSLREILEDESASSNTLMENSSEVGPVPIDVAAEVGSLVDGLRTAHPDVRFSYDPREERPAAQMLGGSANFSRVVVNLLVNAIEGDGHRGATHVQVSIEKLGRSVRLRVSDDGPGFPQRMLEEGIAQFRTTKPMGQGIGLYISSMLVEASQGRLDVGNWDQGAFVEIDLPRVEFPVESPEIGPPNADVLPRIESLRAEA